MADWKDFEENVRATAEIKWSAKCAAKHIAGVNIDGVIEASLEHYICIEMTKRDDLNKVREDIVKLSTVRHGLFLDNIFTECYVVLNGEPTVSMVESGEKLKIKVISYDSLKSSIFNFQSYLNIRLISPFGSAIDPVKGTPDATPYVPVRYEDRTNGIEYSITDIYDALCKEKDVILIGEFGTGKSRCVKELFEIFSKNRKLCLSIDMRDHYGAKRANDIIRRHLDDIGLSSEADGYIKIFNNSHSTILLDGFDEIATSQPWSAEANRLRELRRHALHGVKDIVVSKKANVLISGRPHYFDTDSEMFSSLGLSQNSTIVLHCANEFTLDEMAKYLSTLSGAVVNVPHWLPRKPLVCHVIKSLDYTQLKKLSEGKDNERDFWSLFMDLVCKREAKFNTFLDADSVHKVLVEIAALTRKKVGDVGPMSLLEIEQAFESAVGHKPSEASAAMLNRLMALGRTSAQNSDRQFVDMFILDGLRAEHTLECLVNHCEKSASEKWINPLYELGVSILAGRIIGIGSNLILTYIKKSSDYGNVQLAIDLICAHLDNHEEINFPINIFINSAHVPYLRFSKKKISNISFQGCLIDELHIDSAQATNVTFENCAISRLYGVSAENGLPEWLKNRNNSIRNFEQVSTQKRISNTVLSDVQKVFLEVVNRAFFQPGSARMETAFYGGFSRAKEEIVTQVLDYLVKNKILEIHKDSIGKLFRPNRTYTHRMKGIRSELTLSKDAIWSDITSLNV